MDPDQIWQDFLAKLRAGSIPARHFRPYHPALAETLPVILSGLRAPLLAAAEDGAVPEVFTRGDQVHFILHLASDSSEFCFSFLVEGGAWFFQHVETIFIRLDQAGDPPLVEFPDLPESTKAWVRDELKLSEMVRLFSTLVEEKGRPAALDWFRDGAGYALGARAWVPLAPPQRAFILYLCWEWANLDGNPVTLVSLDDTRAVVRASLRYFELYQRSTHLRQQISRADYIALFETIWTNRAAAAGWSLVITYSGEFNVTFTFSR